MKISDLIERLEVIKATRGEVDVFSYGAHGCMARVDTVEVMDSDLHGEIDRQCAVDFPCVKVM